MPRNNPKTIRAKAVKTAAKKVAKKAAKKAKASKAR